jgi:hypothetical protein
VGIPFAVLLLFFAGVFIICGKIIVAYSLGKLMAKYAQFELHYFLLFLVGLLSFTLLSWIPIVGNVISLVAIVSGIGVTPRFQ